MRKNLDPIGTMAQNQWTHLLPGYNIFPNITGLTLDTMLIGILVRWWDAHREPYREWEVVEASMCVVLSNSSFILNICRR
jgi:hypothetical protein